MKRRTYLTGMASVGALTTIGATGATAAPGDGQDVLVVSDDTGDNQGNGDLVHPTDDSFYSDVWDLEEFRVGQDESTIYFDFDMVDLQNPFQLPDGWSHEYFKIYIRDPNAPSDAPTSTTNLSGNLNVDFTEPWHYVLLAHGEDYQALVDPNGTEKVPPENSGVTVDGTTVSVSIPRSPVSDISSTKLIPFVTPFDGGFMRPIQETASQWNIGGGSDATPKVMDMVPPEDTNQTDLLTPESEGENVVTPYFDLGGSGPDVPQVGDNTPTDLDGDGLFEDVDGDGDGDGDDALAYSANRRSDAVRNNPDLFDFDDDGESGTVFDVIKLWQKIKG